MTRSESAGELRLALCLRGGVSLAVWMGGACREISALTAAMRTNGTHPVSPCERAQATIYEGLLGIAGYHRVTLDVIAGSSAGGLNGVLLATHLVYGMRFDSGVRDTWLQVGDLESLTRHPNDYPVQSLLRGDKGFYARVVEEVQALLESSAAWPPKAQSDAPPLVRLILTATRISPRTDYIRPSVGDPFPASRSAAHFRFRHSRVDGFDSVPDVFTDFSEGTAGIKAIDRLAYAARTTSSFPGAFEPATPFVGAPDPAPKDAVDLSGISSETGAADNGDGRVELVDGGVLDNVPLTWAIRAVAGAPALQPVDRWLLYLQPVPPDSPVPRGKETRSLGRLVQIVKTVIRTKLTSESILDDAAELRDAWAQAQRQRGAAGGIPGDPCSAELRDRDQRAKLLTTYKDTVACMEADRLVRLLEDPIQVLGPDPLPMPATTSPLGDAADGRDVLAQLRDGRMPRLVLDPAADEHLDVTAFRSPFAPARAVSLAFDWVRAAEAAAGPEHRDELREPAGRARSALYRARFACEVLVAARDRLLLGSIPRTGGHAEQWVQAAYRTLTAIAGNGSGSADLNAAGSTESLGGGELARVARAVIDTPPVECRGADPDPDRPLSFLVPVWTDVARTCRDFGAALVGMDPVPGFTALTEAAHLDIGSGGLANILDVLAGAEIVLGPLRPDPLSQPTGIRFHTMSAAARSPLERDLLPESEALTSDERVDRKLSGNKLMNFASFLSARWRLNDWTWGRLDAASSLVDVVARPERVEALGDAELLARVRTLHRALTDDDPELKALIGDWDAGVTEEKIRERYRELITSWLHWNVLREELPVLRKLNTRPGIGDLPPLRSTLDEAATGSRPPLAKSDLRTLGDVGSESIRGLFKNRYLSRATLRLALVAWRAVQPAGRGWWSRIARAGFAVTKPLVIPSLVIGFLAPGKSLLATLFAWVAVAAAGEVWFSPPTHALLAGGTAYAIGSLCWHHWRRPLNGRSRLSRLLLPGLAALVALLGLGFGYLDQVSWRLDTPIRVLVTFAAASAAVAASLWWMPAAGERKQRLRSSFVARTAIAAGLVAAAVLAVVLTQVTVPAVWLTAAVLYAVLALETVCLTRYYPSPDQPAPKQTSDAASAVSPRSQASV
jgi:patatin-related protein